MPYIKAQTPQGARYYFVEELSYLPEGAQFHTVPVAPQAPATPSPPPGPSAFELRLKKWEQDQLNSRLNTLRDQARVANEVQRRTAPPPPKPQSKPTVYLAKVIDPSVR
jgi:hypothetical protein